MRSDPSMAVVAVVVVVGLVLLARHGRSWWHRHTGEHHPARVGRLLIAGLALLGLGALTAGMAVGAGGDSTADPEPDGDDVDATPALNGSSGPAPADPGSGPPVTASVAS